MKKRGFGKPKHHEGEAGNGPGGIERGFRYDYLIFNEKLSQAVEEFKSVYLAEKCRTERLEYKLKKIIKELEE